jgi:hypothetical protein
LGVGMRYIKKIIRKKTITSQDGKEITLFFYDIGDGDVAKTPQKFKVGDRVEAWFNERWDEIRIKPYEEKKRSANEHR